MKIDEIRQFLPIKRLRESRPLVAVLNLHGVISPGPAALRGQKLDFASLAGPIQAAFSLRGVKAVALMINSPGGSPVQSALIHDRIRSLAEEKDIPVLAFTEDVAASGGYWLACAADEIFANENSLVGSIGVISASFGFQDLIAKIGVERRVHTQGENKMLLDPFQPEDPKDLKRLDTLQKDIHDSFKSHVKARRGDRLAKRRDKTLFSGEVWTGRRALELGLVDGIGDLHGITKERYGDKVRLRLVGRPRNWLRRRIGLEGRSDLPGEWLAALEARALWARYGL